MLRKLLNVVVIIALTTPLQGCFLLAGVAALGGGGYYVGTKAGKREEERIKTQALIDVKRELEEKEKAASSQDQTISTQIGQNYLAGQLNSGIAVYPEVRNGVVILHGRVPDAATAERAIAAARKTPGVQRIISNLVILNQPRPLGAPVQQPQQGMSQQQLQQQYLQQQYLMQQQQMQQNQQLQMVPNYPQMQYQQMQQQPSQQPQRINYFQLPPTQQNMSENSAQKKTQLLG